MLSQLIGSAADVVVLVVLFGVTIFVHELGHFLLAVWSGMAVDTFSLGFGPSIWEKRFRGIRFKIGALPVGGYVALPQLDPTGMSAVQGSAGEPRALPAIAPWRKIAVSVAGAVGNLIFAALLAWIIFIFPEQKPPQDEGKALIGFVDPGSVASERGLKAGDQIVAVNGEAVKTWNDFSVLCLLAGGHSNDVTLTVQRESARRDVRVPTTDTDMGVAVEGIGRSLACVVGGVEEGSPAAQAGLQPGDLIRKFDGRIVASTEHFVALVARHAGEPTPIVVERKGLLLHLTVQPRFDAARGKALIGVQISSGFELGTMPWMQYHRPWDQLKGDAMGIVRLLKALVTPHEAGQAAKNLGGPVMILAALWVSIKISLLNAVGFLRFLNVNLAILNLLPIPVLDGGHVMFALWEAITRRPANPKVVNFLVNVFATLLIGVIILLSFRDVVRAPRLLKAFGLLRREQAAQFAAVAATNAAAGTNAVADTNAAAAPPAAPERK